LREAAAVEKKIKVPEGMLEAARRAHIKYEGTEPGVFLTEKIVEAVLLWLSENAHREPACPSHAQMRAVFDGLGMDYGRTGTIFPHVFQIIVEWQRIMFLEAPRPSPVVDKVKRALAGSTLTAGDAVELMDAVRRCTSPEVESEPCDGQRSFSTPFGIFEIDDRVPPGEIRLHQWDGPTILKNVGTGQRDNP
jgi:hypothetical protein